MQLNFDVISSVHGQLTSYNFNRSHPVVLYQYSTLIIRQ